MALKIIDTHKYTLNKIFYETHFSNVLMHNRNLLFVSFNKLQRQITLAYVAVEEELDIGRLIAVAFIYTLVQKFNKSYKWMIFSFHEFFRYLIVHKLWRYKSRRKSRVCFDIFLGKILLWRQLKNQQQIIQIKKYL